MTSTLDPLVFDAEPLIAHADDEPGSEAVDSFLDAVATGETTGYINVVTLSEIRYVLARKYDRDVADEYLEWVQQVGVEPVEAQSLWERASEFILQYNPALGDAFALATARAVEGTLVSGGNNDYDDVTDVSIERFRDGAA